MPAKKQNKLVLFLFGLPFVIWLALLMAPYSSGGLPQVIENLNKIASNPMHIQSHKDSLKTVLIFVGIYSLCMAMYLSTRKNYRRGEEHGSAKWGDVFSICKKYREKNFVQNKIITQNFLLGLNGRKHRRNLNTLVTGGSGAMKTRGYAKPNILQALISMFILDPKGELLRDTGRLLKKKGYKIKVLNLIDMEKSDCYNPFAYLKTENDVQRLVTNLFKATTPKNSQSQDPFWDTAGQMLLMAIIFYLLEKGMPDEQNFAMVLELLNEGQVDEEDDSNESILDELFRRLDMEIPNHIAVKYYNLYRKGAGKTLKSIQITLISRLEKFNISAMAYLTNRDDFDFASMGAEKTAIFAIVPDNDTSFNFLVSMMYTQIFQQLFYAADHEKDGRLKVPVHFIMDEFANVSLPDDFEKLLSVMRSREIYVSIIIQNLAQLKALFKDHWESIVGNCDTFLYLGGNEQSTHKYVSELLGKATIDTNTYGRSKGRNGSYSTNDQNAGRELLTPDEVRKLENDYALVFMRGEDPIIDRKFDILTHPNVRYTPDGRQVKGYRHKLLKQNVNPEDTKEFVLDKVDYATSSLEVVSLDNLTEDELRQIVDIGDYLVSDVEVYDEEELQLIYLNNKE